MRNSLANFRSADEVSHKGHVLVVDDEVSILNVLQEYLILRGYLCSTFGSATALCEWLDQGGELATPVCLLCDLAMPTMTGLTLQQRLQSKPEIAVVMMSGAASNSEVVQAFRAGALDFLLKPLDDELLFSVLERALASSRTTIRRRERQAHFGARVALLTSRELATLRLVAKGKLNREIADQFGIALRTVKLYRQRGFEKLGLELNADLVRLYDDDLL